MWGPYDGISAHVRREVTPELSLCHGRTQKEGSHLQARRRVLTRTYHAGGQISDFQPLELEEDKFLLFKPPSLWYLVMAVQANTVGLIF